MATPCKNRYEIERRWIAWNRLCYSRGAWAGIPTPELYGIETGKEGEQTIEDLLDALKKKSTNP